MKDYLEKHGLKIIGQKVELVARGFSASENHVTLVKTAVEGDLRDEYENKLKIDDIKLPDPVAMEIGWLKEEEGRWFWPMVLYHDIFNYLTFYPSELGSTDLSEYKACNAYSYFKFLFLLYNRCIYRWNLQRS